MNIKKNIKKYMNIKRMLLNK